MTGEESGWRLRQATPGDSAAVSALLARSYPTLWAAHYPAETLEAVLPFVARANDRLLASGNFFVAMTDGGQAVGCGGWSAEWPGTVDRRDPGVAHLRHFAADPDCQRQGIGRAVLNRCIAEAGSAGFTRLMADAAYGAESFYAASGFRIVGVGRAVIAGTVLPGVMMQRAL